MQTREHNGQSDVIIVGGGIAGLVAANYLVQAGATVTLFEKATNLGGRAATQKIEGYDFNRGLHAFYRGGDATQILQELHITYGYGIPKKVSAFYQGRLYPFPTSITSLLQTNLLSIGEKLELMRLFTSLPKLDTSTIAHLSVQVWLDQTIKSQKLRQALAALACTQVYNTALDEVSAEVFIKRVQLSLKHPIHYISGGWQTLINALRDRASQAGAHIINNTSVESVEYSNGEAQAIYLGDGRRLTARAIVIATDPHSASKLLDHGQYHPLNQIMNALVPAHIACLDVALSSLPNPRHAIVQDLEKSRFLTAQSVYAQVAPEGGAMIHVGKQLDFRKANDPHKDEQDLEEFLDIVQPGWRKLVVKRIFLPHIMASGVLPLAKNHGFAGKPDIQVPGIARLYLAGDWIGEGFQIDASMASARKVAMSVLAKDMVNSKENAAKEIETSGRTDRYEPVIQRI